MTTRSRQRNHPAFKSWDGLKQRCSNPRNKDYARYGGRGIKVCARWRASFAAFVEDMGPKPSPAHSIDRINNDGDYEPGNCRWALCSQQQRNRSSNRLIEHGGQVRSITDWASRAGISRPLLAWRLRNGWPLADALAYRPGTRAVAT